GDLPELERRPHVDVHRELDALGLVERPVVDAFDVRPPDDLDLVLAAGAAERLGDQPLLRLGADLLPELLLEHLARHLAGPEPLHAHLIGRIPEHPLEVGADLLRRDPDRQCLAARTGFGDLDVHSRYSGAVLGTDRKRAILPPSSRRFARSRDCRKRCTVSLPRAASNTGSRAASRRIDSTP